MPRLAALCLMLPLALPAPILAAAHDQPARATQRSVAAFRDCFIAAQDKAKRPWAYVLNGDSGGTFSTVPGADGQSPYLMSVRDADGARRVTLSGEASAGSGQTIAAALDGCLG